MGLGLLELLVLLSCCIVVLLALTQEGDLHITPVFFHAIEQHASSSGSGSSAGQHDLGSLMTTYANGVAPAENEIVPAPLITDLDGDGINEVVLVTREPKLKIFRFKPPYVASSTGNSIIFDRALKGGKLIDWNQLELVREIGLLSSSLVITSGRQVVGLSSGYLRPYHSSSKNQNRAQVIVLINESWGIFVFNHLLHLLWTRSIETDFSLKYLAEVSILIDPHPMRQGSVRSAANQGGAYNDTGVIIVGGRLGLKSDLHKDSHGLHHESLGGVDRMTRLGGDSSNEQKVQGPAPLEFPEDYAEILQGRVLRPGHRYGGKTKSGADGSEASQEAEDDESLYTPTPEYSESLGADPIHFERTQHFSYYAFEGLSGDLRWKHDSTSFLEEVRPNWILKPQHESTHSGEGDWRLYRTSILQYALPHLWRGGRYSSTLELAHFEKTRSGAQKREKKAKREIKSNFFVRDALPLPGSNGGVNKLRAHSESEHILRPNAIVAHLRDGVEILHFYSGRPLCRLTLQAGQIHVDMNGDGVVDHVEVVGGTRTLQQPKAHQAKNVHDHTPDLPCLVIVKSGIPPTKQMFNASICTVDWSQVMQGMFPAGPPSGGSGYGGAGSSHSFTSRPSVRHGRSSQNGFSLEGGIGSASETAPDGKIGIPSVAGFFSSAGKNAQQKKLKAAHPIVLQEPRTVGKTSKQRRYHSFFYLSTGLVSSFNSDGSRTWHTQTRATWPFVPTLDEEGVEGAPMQELTLAQQSLRPSITAYSLYSDTPPDHVLVTGERHVAIISYSGTVRIEYMLPSRDIIIALPKIGDFNNDGLNDLVFQTTKGYYGFTVERRVGGQLFSILTAIILVVFAVFFVVKVVQTVKERRKLTGGKTSGKQRKTTASAFGGLRTIAKAGKAI